MPPEADPKPETGDDPKPDPKPSGDDPKPEPKPTETVEFWKQQARDNEKRAKANADAAKKLKDLEDSNKSEIQKATEAATEAAKRADDAELKALRLEVAGDKGLSAAQAKRLQGATREELEADAEELLESFAPEGEKRTPRPGQKPRENLRGGSGPDEEPEETDPRKLAAKVPRPGF